MCEERDATGSTVTKRFFAEGEQRVGGTDAGSYYYTRDHLGSIREVTNSSGGLVSRFDYDPWGNRVSTFGTMNLDFGFTGHYYHANSGLYLTVYRGYTPTLGRWISRDPMGEDGGLNLYGYVGNDPEDLWDVLGLSSCDWELSIGHGHVPGTQPVFRDTNNRYYIRVGNSCTAYTGCGSNALNQGGLGADFPPAGRNNHYDRPTQGNDTTLASDLRGTALADLVALKQKAQRACKTSGCKQITITVICQLGGPYPEDFTNTGLCGNKYVIPCDSCK